MRRREEKRREEGLYMCVCACVVNMCFIKVYIVRSLSYRRSSIHYPLSSILHPPPSLLFYIRIDINSFAIASHPGSLALITFDFFVCLLFDDEARGGSFHAFVSFIFSSSSSI
jgi:hypothetical protein